eukprot:CAMPEP_0170154996 /NCGR_PEP_ID=MMETSP0033_2-20121228/59465_1 /TAXON_ID=195969 /ORGANISM="Dolichomastix tenuilepis, Strain CCMP3274" /LENGTH=91 /DNA_ID=CAMNT_0010392289 /DNA_START=1 /DNA_END=273 /DNA_ORIENTATION=+
MEAPREVPEEPKPDTPGRVSPRKGFSHAQAASARRPLDLTILGPTELFGEEMVGPSSSPAGPTAGDKNQLAPYNATATSACELLCLAPEDF